MTLTLEIANSIGRDRIAESVGVGLTAVSNAVVRGSFPSAWYVAISNLCSERGQECPPELFGMRGDISRKQNAAIGRKSTRKNEKTGAAQ